VPDTTRLDEVFGQLATARADRPIAVAWPGGAFRRYRDSLLLTPELPAHDSETRLPWDVRRPLALPSGLGTLRLVAGGPLRRDALTGHIEVRFRTAGLRCAPAGRSGHHDLKHLFQEAGVPPWLRDRVPLVVVGGELAAIADRWVCAAAASSDGTAGLESSGQAGAPRRLDLGIGAVAGRPRVLVVTFALLCGAQMQDINPITGKIADLRGASRPSGGTFDYPDKQERLTEVLRELEDPQVWNQPERAQALGRERARLEGVVA